MNKEKVNEEIKELEARLEKLKAEVNKPELEPYDWSKMDCYAITHKGFSVIASNVNDLFQFPRGSKGKAQSEEYAKELRLNSMILRLKQALGEDREFEDYRNNYYLYRASNSFAVGIRTCARYIGVIYFSSNENIQKVCDWLNENWDFEKGERK